MSSKFIINEKIKKAELFEHLIFMSNDIIMLERVIDVYMAEYELTFEQLSIIIRSSGVYLDSTKPGVEAWKIIVGGKFQ